jgi:hypothetical protein
MFKMDFAELKRDIETPLSILSAAIDEVKQSDALKKILGIVLTVGYNFIQDLLKFTFT